jgi:hypothetical protein
MRGRFQDVKQYVEENIFSDSYAKHFGGMVPKGAQAPTPGMQKNLITCSIIWKGDPITAVKTSARTPVNSAIEKEWQSSKLNTSLQED